MNTQAPEQFDPAELWQMVKRAKIMTRNEYAEQLGVDHRTIANWTSRQYKPSNTVWILAAKLKREWSDLLPSD